MGKFQQIYNPDLPLELLFDEYTIPTINALWRRKEHETEACFYMFHRKTPFDGGYTIAAGLEFVADWIENFKFSDKSISALSESVGNDGKPKYSDNFLKYLEKFRIETLKFDAAPEGSVVFPQEPMARAVGRVVEGLMIETFTLNNINFQSLIATKSARTCYTAKGDPVFDFGFRRAQGIDGALSASRAAYIGGTTGTSNRLASYLFGIPASGTHPHALVMFFDTQLEAFVHFAEAQPNNSVFLVDTYSSLHGIRDAISVMLQLKARGFKPIGIRLDSGDLDYWSKTAKEMFDVSGLENISIFASNDLDEYIIESLKSQGSPINCWGVGTRLVTGHCQAALGGVWKLSAVKRGGFWTHKMKISEQSAKSTIPGMLQVRRFMDEAGLYSGDLIYDDILGVEDAPNMMIDPTDFSHHKTLSGEFHDILQPVLVDGKRTVRQESLKDMRERTKTELSRLHPSIKRFTNPHIYPVGLTKNLYSMRKDMICQMKGLVE